MINATMRDEDPARPAETHSLTRYVVPVLYIWRENMGVPTRLIHLIESNRFHHKVYVLIQHCITMAYMLPHLSSGWEVDQAIVTEEDRVVMIRFGRDQDPTCMVQDEVLANIAEKVKNFAVIYLVDIDEVADFNTMYEIVDECTTMFFYRNKHIMVDLGTGDNNKINWAMTDKQELIDVSVF
jgi:DIM1 family U5 snRNP protein